MLPVFKQICHIIPLQSELMLSYFYFAMLLKASLFRCLWIFGILPSLRMSFVPFKINLTVNKLTQCLNTQTGTVFIDEYDRKQLGKTRSDIFSWSEICNVFHYFGIFVKLQFSIISS